MSPHTFALGFAFAVSVLAVPALSQPTSNIGSKEKMETCKFGAAEQNLKGKEEQDFVRKCMANEPAVKKSSSSSSAGGTKTAPGK